MTLKNTPLMTNKILCLRCQAYKPFVKNEPLVVCTECEWNILEWTAFSEADFIELKTQRPKVDSVKDIIPVLQSKEQPFYRILFVQYVNQRFDLLAMINGTYQRIKPEFLDYKIKEYKRVLAITENVFMKFDLAKHQLTKK
jgi:hypothetical protein